MLHVLQYFVGTSIAPFCVPADLIVVHCVVGGAKVRGSSESSGGGKGCRFRGNILRLSEKDFEKTHSMLTPGSVTDAWTKEEMHTKNRYAKKNGTAGETCCERYGPLRHHTQHQWLH